jgi:hypothetical protein
MSEESQFLKRFIEIHLVFFTQPLPHEEMVYNIKYTLAKTDWRAIKREIEKYRISEELITQLDHLFEKAEKFTFTLKTSGDYFSALLPLRNQWLQIQNLALEIANKMRSKHI